MPCVEKHKFSGVLHLLYLKALSNCKSVDFDEKLKAFAIKIPDRQVLFELIHDDKALSNIPTEVESIPEIENAVEIISSPATDIIDSIEDPDKATEYSVETMSSMDNSIQYEPGQIEENDRVQEIEENFILPEVIEASSKERARKSTEEFIDNNIVFEGFSDNTVQETEIETQEIDSIEYVSKSIQTFELGQVEEAYQKAEKAPQTETKSRSFYDWLDVNPSHNKTKTEVRTNSK